MSSYFFALVEERLPFANSSVFLDIFAGWKFVRTTILHAKHWFSRNLFYFETGGSYFLESIQNSLFFLLRKVSFSFSLPFPLCSSKQGKRSSVRHDYFFVVFNKVSCKYCHQMLQFVYKGYRFSPRHQVWA